MLSVAIITISPYVDKRPAEDNYNRLTSDAKLVCSIV